MFALAATKVQPSFPLSKLVMCATFLYYIFPLPHPVISRQRLEEARVAHEETLEAERQVHRERVAQGEGAIARLEHDLKEAAAEEERCES